MNWSKGLRLYENIVLPEAQTLLYNLINMEEDWYKSKKLTRQVKQYGYEYDYNLSEPRTKKLKKTKKAPKFLRCIANVLYEQGLMRNRSNQIIVNKYKPGEGIAAHRDHNPIFDNDIATLSLGSEWVMEFKPIDKTDKTKIEISLPIGSLLVFGDDARYLWTHEIRKRLSDNIDGKRRKRKDRISVTFRTVRKEFRE